MIFKAFYLKGQNPIRIDIEVNTKRTSLLARAKLEIERQKILRILKLLLDEKVIKSIRRPHNKKIQDYLDELVYAKKEINKTLKKLMILFK